MQATAWYKLEVAKRRLVYTLIELGLPLRQGRRTRETDSPSSSSPTAQTPMPSRVLTGHDDGVITINIAEADEREREKRRRNQMHEPYRTLLGHFRHEIGHYYWDRLVATAQRARRDSASCSATRRRTTPRRCKRHYETGPARRLAGAIRQRVRHVAPVGRLGRDLGALPAHGRHAGDRGGVRAVAQAATCRRAA